MNEPTANSLMDLMRFVTSKLVVTMSALNHLQLSSFSAHFFSFRPLVSPSSALASFPLHPSVLPLSPLYPPCPPSSRSFSSRGENAAVTRSIFTVLVFLKYATSVLCVHTSQRLRVELPTPPVSASYSTITHIPV